MKVIIQTQTYENYGAHDWDGEGECPQRWKPKGGYTFIFTCNPRDKYKLAALVKINNEMFVEEIIDIAECEEAFFNVRDHCSEYQHPTFIERGVDCWLAHRIAHCEFDDFDYTRESWIVGKGQAREAMKREVCIDGLVMSWSDYVKEQAA